MKANVRLGELLGFTKYVQPNLQRSTPSEPPSNAGATGAFGEDCLSATADGGAGAPLAGMRPGPGTRSAGAGRGAQGCDQYP